jgi:hypothetical protein
VLIAAGLMAVMIAVSSVTYLAVERPAPEPARQPAMAGRGHPATE